MLKNKCLDICAHQDTDTIMIKLNIRISVETCYFYIVTVHSRVGDPDTDPDSQDPHVLGLPDRDWDPLVRGMDPDLALAQDPDPSLSS
jgi:hypothetical protein